MKVLIVTGASRGIGAATARLAARRGFAVCVNYLSDRRAAQAVVGQIEGDGGRAAAMAGDVAREDEVRRLFDFAEQELGSVDALVNNAGLTGSAGRLEEAATGTLRRVLDVNVLGVILCAREAVRRMATRGGAIVNVSSAAATLGSPDEYVWYAASKGAVDAFTLGLAREVARQGIRVNAVSPGLVATGIHDASGVAGRLERLAPQLPSGRAAAPEEVAEAILWLLSDGASYCLGANLRVAGGR